VQKPGLGLVGCEIRRQNLYRALPPAERDLLNEFLKEHRKVEQHGATIAAMKKNRNTHSGHAKD
jgi:hypothetical protein